jgi:hypothetical protein
MIFNINEEVKVRLTPAGRAFHAARFATFKAQTNHGLAYCAPVENAEGWSRWQLWSLIQTFGGDNGAIHLGGNGVPFAVEIEIPDSRAMPR